MVRVACRTNERTLRSVRYAFDRQRSLGRFRGKLCRRPNRPGTDPIEVVRGRDEEEQLGPEVLPRVVPALATYSAAHRMHRMTGTAARGVHTALPSRAIAGRRIADRMQTPPPPKGPSREHLHEKPLSSAQSAVVKGGRQVGARGEGRTLVAPTV